MARSRILRMAVPALVIHAGVSLAGLAQAQPTDAERAAAATRTASTNLLCGARVLGPFYWEIGRREGTLVSGSVTPRGSTVTITADTVLSVASASKWVFAAYAIERFGNTASARPFLNLTSGYSNFRTSDCPTDGTVAECLPGSRNRKESTAKMFHYDGGHMQQHAINIGLGPLDNVGLGVEISSILGTQPPITYAQPGIAGGISTTARDYSAFLRRLLVGAASPLKLGAQLGTNPVCTMPSASCNAYKIAAVPEAWHYSVGHWIEDDPATTPSSNFAYSSPGSFGFYPWVDTDRNVYGVVARQTEAFTGVDEGHASVKCGRMIRLAWKTGVPQ